jgi:hypothetical protein
MSEFDVTNRFTGKVQLTAKLDCAEGVNNSIKLGLAVRWAIEDGANLGGADLEGAYLERADLGGADLRGANLEGANLGDAKGWRGTLLGHTPIVSIGPIGSERGTLMAQSDEFGVYIKRGCWSGSLGDFREAVDASHSGNHYGRAYQALCDWLEVWAKEQISDAPDVDIQAFEVSA